MEKIFDSFASTVEIRWKVKQAEADLALIERQYEMGNIGECVINEAVRNLQHASGKLRSAKQNLENEQQQIIFG